MIACRRISAETMDSFVRKSHFLHYMKTSAWAEFKKTEDHMDHTYLGFFEDDQLCATANVLSGSFLGHHYCYIPKGPCLDYYNSSIMEEVMRLLQNYAKDQKAEFLRIDPDVIRVSRTITGELTEEINNEAITEKLKELGFRHKGYGYAYDGSWTNRYTLITDIDKPMEEVIKGFSKQRRTSLNRHAVSGVTTRPGDEADIPDLMRFESMLAEMDGFQPHSFSFFQNLLEQFGEHARLYVTEINLETMIQGISEELSSKKYRKDPEAKAAKEKDLEHAQLLLQEYGPTLAIACGLFLYEGDMSWDLYTYNHKAFNFIKPVDNLHVFAMQDMQKLGVKRYDLCGFSGVTTKDDPEYGLYAYKRSFGPAFIEQIGEFDSVFRPSAYHRFLKEKSFEVRARHKLWKLRFQKKHTS